MTQLPLEFTLADEIARMADAEAPNLPASGSTPPAQGVGLLPARQERYGRFRDNAALSQRLKGVLRSGVRWQSMQPDQQEALEMIAHKISRILCGDPHYDDSWVDIAGYATRVADRLQGKP